MTVLKHAAADCAGPMRRAIRATIVLGLLTAPALVSAQTSLADQKTQAEIDKLELEREKIRIDLIKSANTGIGGTGTVAGPELTAEGLLLSHFLQEQSAAEIAQRFLTWRGAPGEGHLGQVVIAFGDQPPSIAEYLAFEQGIERLRSNLVSAVEQWGEARGNEVASAGNRFDPVTAITVATTVASLFRVDTTVAGAALATPNDQFRAILLQTLREKGVPTDLPRTIAGKPRYSERQFDSLRLPSKEATDAYREYLDLLKRKGGKLDALEEQQRVAGVSLATALADYEALRKALYTPAAGVLAAHLIDEQESLFREGAQRPVIYIHHQKAALTTTTRRGFLTGLSGIPAFISGSMVVDYSFAGTTPAAGAVTVSSPTMRITGVRAWLDSEASTNSAGEARASGSH